METSARYALIGMFTLSAIAAAFAFVYWLNTTGGFGQRAVYQVRFESSVSGLLVGSNVLFNGVRVGEVTSLKLNPSDPRQVIATVSVDAATPVRSDTQVDLDFQGLTGAPVILLKGGSPTASPPASADGQPPVLAAPPGAGQSLTQSARETLAQLDSILAQNAKPLHDAITGISTFAQALARNADRVDGILAGIERMTGGASARGKIPIYTLSAPTELHACPPGTQHGSLVVPEPGALMAFNTDKLLVVGTAPEPGLTDKAQWADNIPSLVQAKVIETLDHTGCFSSVSRPHDELEADHRLILDIRDFRIALSPQPSAVISLSAKIMAGRDKITATRSIQESTPLSTLDSAGAVAATDAAFGKAMRQLVPWVVENSSPARKH
jgi:phospholipid/cholesterol/gamma-HCH transport system substrate-binding protein